MNEAYQLDIAYERLGVAQAHIRDLEAENAALTKRVAELEGIERHLRLLLTDLQSQLAWTQVSDGLPTEPGRYLFDNISETSLYTLTDTGEFLKHTDNGTERWEAAPMHYWDSFLRIELPKESGET